MLQVVGPYCICSCDLSMYITFVKKYISILIYNSKTFGKQQKTHYHFAHESSNLEMFSFATLLLKCCKHKDSDKIIWLELTACDRFIILKSSTSKQLILERCTDSSTCHVLGSSASMLCWHVLFHVKLNPNLIIFL